MNLITVLGASGFIGSHLVTALETRGAEHLALTREDQLPRQHLGEVIYCIGLTSDFRTQPLETVEAHVCKLREVLQNCEFNSLTYLSSTRVYGHGCATATETDSVNVNPNSADELYNISKLMGESLALNSGKNGRVVRLANVYGDDFSSANFLTAVIADAISTGKLIMQTSPESAKDYVSVADVTDVLLKVVTSGSERIYNLASGQNLTNANLAAAIQKLTGCSIEFVPNAPVVTFPVIDINRISSEFAFQPRVLLDDLSNLISSHRAAITDRGSRKST
jgi:nucleoside-diphosphate-sugar epimerase